MTALLIYVARVNPAALDFATFHASATAWRLGQPVYVAEEFANLNPPTTVLLLWPLSYLPVDDAFRAHTAISMISVIAGLVAVRGRLRLSFERWAWLGSALIVSYPASMAWIQGQWQWWLFYPMTRAWLASPSGAAGWWLAVSLAVKPPLALMALLLPRPILIRAAVGASALAIGTVPILGLAPWIDWLTVTNEISWVGIPENGSIWGIVARWKGTGWQLSDASWLVWAGVGCAAAGLAWLVVRLSGPSRWVAAMLWHLAVSPVGWPSYLVLVAVPMVASIPARNPFAMVGTALVVFAWAFRPILGASVVAAGILSLLIAWIGPTPAERVRQGSSGAK